jgi:hypothetical protein
VARCAGVMPKIGFTPPHRVIWNHSVVPIGVVHSVQPSWGRNPPPGRPSPAEPRLSRVCEETLKGMRFLRGRRAGWR